MALWHKKKADSPEEKPAKPFIEDYPYEDIDSITADLPGQDEPDETDFQVRQFFFTVQGTFTKSDSFFRKPAIRKNQKCFYRE